MLKFHTLLEKLKAKNIMLGHKTMELPEAYSVKKLIFSHKTFSNNRKLWNLMKIICFMLLY